MRSEFDVVSVVSVMLGGGGACGQNAVACEGGPTSMQFILESFRTCVSAMPGRVEQSIWLQQDVAGMAP